MMTGVFNKSGGAAAAGGFSFQANIGAIAGIHMLRGVPVQWTAGLTGAAPCAVSFETSGPGDDMALKLAGGGTVEIQVRKGLRANKRFWSALDALCEGIHRGRCDYGILIVCPDSSVPVRRRYARALERIGAGRNDGASTEQETMASRLAANGYDAETICARVRIRTVSALEDAGDAIAAARAELGIVCADDRQVTPAWHALCQDALSATTSRSRRTADVLLACLRNSGIEIQDTVRGSDSFVRNALAEDARHALEGIADRVGKVRLLRGEHLAAIRRALDQGRYVEIRGEPGVGKSGLLKRLAEERSTQSCIVVLSHGRVTTGGWREMRTALGLQGTAHALLVDLASSGGATLFVDGLDSFTEDERLTVVDLVREAAELPGFSVVATTRRGFGGEDEEREWLPSEALDRLGRVPVTIEELSNDEVSELCHAAPDLAPLLSDTHPARAVVRNLFRLDRLARKSNDGRSVRTEIDMAEYWWRMADGGEKGKRARARLLRTLAQQTLASEPLSAEAHPEATVDALVASGTLRDLGSDRMAFRHDILRDWAVANVLFDDPKIMDSLPLERLAPSHLVRGFELAARMQLERTEDHTGWRFLLDAVSQEGTHGSWRRAVLLAPVHSEIGDELLPRVAAALLADDARLLVELIRTVKAVEVEPFEKYLSRVGLNVPEAPTHLHVLSGPSWFRLLRWLLIVTKDDLPEAAKEDTAQFFEQASWTAIRGHSELGSSLAYWFYDQLQRTDRRRTNRLASILRSGFLVMSRSAPSLAASYLRSLVECDVYDPAIRAVWEYSGFVAPVVPNELAELTLAVLIPRREERISWEPPGMQRPFGSGGDPIFTPASPTHGPFLALLWHAPAIGLKLIRQLLDHAISFRSRGRVLDTDTLSIHFSDGERIFSRLETYRWSRETGNGGACVQSALMALESWAHRRVENGETVEAVIADVLPPTDGPAAYLLVAVDLILSHWPNSARAAIAFVGCPELLCLDLGRGSADILPIPDLLRLDHWLGPTTEDTSGADSLKARPSRQSSLDALLGQYALLGLSEIRSELAVLLKQAVERLGSYGERANRSHPEFMAAWALNYLDPANWRQDGKSVGAWEYVSPPEEMEHLERLKAATSPDMDEWHMRTQVQAAMWKGAPSPEFVAKAVSWARRPHRSTVDFRDLAPIIAAAVIAIRDGDEGLRSRHRGWAREVLLGALTAETDIISPDIGIQYNPVAMAFIGLVFYSMRENFDPPDIGALLEAACRPDLLAAPGFRAAAAAIEQVDERLPRALLRTAFASCIHSRREYPAQVRSTDIAARLQQVVDRELSWLLGEDDEPAWPEFPMGSPAYRRHMRVRGRPGVSTVEFKNGGHSEPEEELYDRSAARWLTDATVLFDIEARPWLRGLAEAYSEWTTVTNGSELDPWAQIERMPSEWNAAYYRLVAHCMPGQASESIDRLALDPIRSLPDESFFDASSHFLRNLDRVYFEQGNLTETEAVRIREVLAERLMGSHEWKQQGRNPSTSIEVNMGSAIAAVFFNNWDRIPLSSCYVPAPGIPRIDPFLPVLERLVANGPNGFVAALVLDLIEVSPRPEHLPFIVAAAEAWRVAYPGNRVFWVDNGVAWRLCAIIENIGTQEPYSSWSPSLRDRVGNILPALVALGVPLAGQIEQDLAGSGKE